MKIRSITSFYDPGLPQPEIVLHQLSEFSREASKALNSAGIEVQSTRLATTPFPHYFPQTTPSKAVHLAQEMENKSRMFGFGYVSCGPALPDFSASYELIPELLAATQDLFLSAIIADAKQIYPRAVYQSAQIIHAAARITPDGFGNLRFAALANVKPGGPFLPGAFHARGAAPACSIAVECADAALSSFQNCTSLSEGCAMMISSFEGFSHMVQQNLQPLLKEYQILFNGFDFSPAPFPQDSCSLGAAIEAVGARLGSHGALAAAAIIADALGKGKWQHTGYNGLMLPVLEDSILAARAAEERLSTQDLLMFSAVCGTGLDTVPLPGDASVKEIESILMDVAALAVRLGKPLTARLMPIPGKSAGDPTEFDFGYFKNSRVMKLNGQILSGPICGNDPIPLTPRIPT